MKAAALLAMLALATTAVAGEVTMIGGVPHVDNTGEPRHGRVRWELSEEWRVGGDSDDAVLFGTINQVLVSGDGTVYLLDAQLAHVEVFDADGVHLRTLGRRGEGPGEFNLPLDMVALPDGSLGVSEGFPGRIVKLGMNDGMPLGTIEPRLKSAADGGFLFLIRSLSTADGLVLSGQDVALDAATGVQTRTYFVQRFGLDGTPLQRYHDVESRWNLADMVLDEALIDYVWDRLAVGSDGRVVMNIPRDRYELTVLAPDGRTERVITRPVEPWVRDQRALTRRHAWLDGIARQFSPGTRTRMFDTEPIVARVTVAADGRIWVLTSRAMWEPQPGVLASYDVFSPGGEYLEIVDVVCEGRSESDLLVFGSGGLVFRITGHAEAMLDLQAEGAMETADDAAAMEVVCYRRVSG